MVSDIAVAAWLRDLETAKRSGACDNHFDPSLPSCTPVDKKRARVEEQQPAVKRQRQHLAPVHPNMAMPRRTPRTPSPSKKKKQQLDGFDISNNNAAMTALFQEDAEEGVQQTPRPFLKTSGTRRDGKATGSTGSPAREPQSGDQSTTDYTAQLRLGVVANVPVMRRPLSDVSVELASAAESVSPSQSASQIRSTSSSQLSDGPERSSLRRPKSPVKSGAALRNAEKPVHFRKLEAHNTPSDVEDLLEQLCDIDAGMGVVPHAVKDTVAEFVREEGIWTKLRPHNIDMPADDTNGAIQELRFLSKIYNKARKLQFAFEAAWNEAVHYPLLDLALDAFPDVELHNVTKAAICSELIPKHGNRREKLESKMVDYTVNLLPRTVAVANHIHELVVSQPLNLQTVNQTPYALVDRLPCAISIETKLAGAGDGLAQLGIWSSAYFSRLRDLRRQCATQQPRRQPSAASTPSVREKEKDMISHPLVIIASDRWVLRIAVDRDDRIDILGVVTLGDTASWVGMYKLTKSLRALARWADGRMREWFETEVLGLRERADNRSEGGPET